MKARLTQIELAVVERYRERPQPHTVRWVGHFIYVFPSFLFAVLGVARADYVALMVAWGVLIGYGVYLVHGAHVEQDRLCAILRKLVRGAKRRNA